MDVLLTVLAVLGCVEMMGLAMVVLPRVGGRLCRTLESGWSRLG
jgi:hypothetical protein